MRIGSINAVVVNAVEGVAYIGDQAVSITPTALRGAVRELDHALPGVPLPVRERAEAEAAVRSLAEEMSRPEPDKGQVAEHVGRLAKILQSAGSLATAAATLTGPLTTLAAWLGRTVGSLL
jgi:hypothetical protein